MPMVNKMKIIKKCLLIMSILLSIFAFGCSKNPEGTQDSNVNSSPKDSLTSVSIAQSHMDRTYCYYFWVRKTDNRFFLDANCILTKDEEYEELNIEGAEITEEDFNRFVELDNKYSFCSNLKKKSIFEDKFFVADKTETFFTVKYGEDMFELQTSGDCYYDVYDCFLQLAEKYKDKSVKDEKI